MKRVVVTGMGVISPLGIGVEKVWADLIAGKSGIVPIEQAKLDIPINNVHSIGMIPEGIFDVNEWTSRDSRTQSGKVVHYGMCAAKQALDDSGWIPTTNEQQVATGVAFGSSIASVDDIYNVGNILHDEKKGLRRVSPFSITKVLPNMTAGHISMHHNLLGPVHTVSTACATGAHAIGDAYRFIQYGDADVMVCGGTEASISSISLAMFQRIGALSKLPPEQASRPFDALRDGFVMSEGAGAFVLEELEHAKRRGAHIYAEVAGYGISGDAYHITKPGGNGAYNCIRSVLKHSDAHIGVGVADIGYINAHATSTPMGDLIELRALQQAMEGNDRFQNGQIAISSTKGATGHMLAAAGAVEAMFSVLALERNVIPPTLKLDNLDNDEFEHMNLVPYEAQDKKLKATMSTSFGFGGTNAALIFSKYK